MKIAAILLIESVIFLTGIMTFVVMAAPYFLLGCSICAVIKQIPEEVPVRKSLYISFIGWTVVILYLLQHIAPLPMWISMGRPDYSHYHPFSFNLQNAMGYGLSIIGICAGYMLLKMKKETFPLFLALLVSHIAIATRKIIISMNSHDWHWVLSTVTFIISYGLIVRYVWFLKTRRLLH